MVQVYSGPTVKVVPKDGEIEIKLDITINVTSEGISVAAVPSNKNIKKDEDEKTDLLIPNFTSGNKLNFGKTIGE